MARENAIKNALETLIFPNVNGRVLDARHRRPPSFFESLIVCVCVYNGGYLWGDKWNASPPLELIFFFNLVNFAVNVINCVLKSKKNSLPVVYFILSCLEFRNLFHNMLLI